MAHGDARVGKWRGNWRMEWVAITLHTTSEQCVSSITTADAHTSAASSRLNWRPRRFKWTRPFRRKTKSGFCVCAITFQTQSTTWPRPPLSIHQSVQTDRDPAPPLQIPGSLSLQVEQPAHKADHSPLLMSRISMGRATLPSPHMPSGRVQANFTSSCNHE